MGNQLITPNLTIKEKKAIQWKNWYAKNKDNITRISHKRIIDKKYRTIPEVKDRMNARRRELRRLDNTMSKSNSKKYRAKRLLQALQRYSKSKIPFCANCKITELRVLALDHINGGGSNHRKQKGVYELAQWAKNNSYPNGFQVLCFNCNFEKYLKNKIMGTSPSVGTYYRYKEKVFNHYGRICQNCKSINPMTLTRDHIKGKGNIMRKNLNHHTFEWITKNNYPADFQVLCMNCNWIKQFKDLNSAQDVMERRANES